LKEAISEVIAVKQTGSAVLLLKFIKRSISTFDPLYILVRGLCRFEQKLTLRVAVNSEAILTNLSHFANEQ
jgi:hypothetical protein